MKQNPAAQTAYRTAPRPGQLSSSMYVSDGAWRWVSSLKSCLKFIVANIIGTSSRSFCTTSSTSSCWVPSTGGKNQKSVHFHTLLALKSRCLKAMSSQRCIGVHVTCSCEERAETHTGSFIFQLHHIHSTRGNQLSKLLTHLHSDQYRIFCAG